MSLKFYQETMGMKLLRTSPNDSAGFTLYFLGYSGDTDDSTADKEGILEYVFCPWPLDNVG